MTTGILILDVNSRIQSNRSVGSLHIFLQYIYVQIQILLIFFINQIELSSCFYTKGLELSFNIQKAIKVGSASQIVEPVPSLDGISCVKKNVALRSSSHTPEASFQNPLESTGVLNKVCLARKTRQKRCRGSKHKRKKERKCGCLFQEMELVL